MNYHRIYDEFIKDRLEKQNLHGWHKLSRPKRSDYFEKHHIFPRCLGGGDEASNIIRLTPEDHFFAHLLLAKMHGGRLWAAFQLMLGLEQYKPITSRRKYDWVIRAVRKAQSGEEAHQYDWTIYELENRKGEQWSGTQLQMSEQLNFSRSLANMLIKGRVKTATGWFFKGTKPRFRGADFAGSAHQMYRSEIFTFVHVNGQRFIGTQFELHKQCGVSESGASNLSRGKVKVANGWFLEGTELPKTGRGSRWRLNEYENQQPDTKICEYCQKPFIRKARQANWNKKRFCSPRCSSLATAQKNKGINFNTEVSIQKHRERMRGNSYTKDKPWSAARRLAWLEQKGKVYVNKKSKRKTDAKESTYPS